MIRAECVSYFVNVSAAVIPEISRHHSATGFAGLLTDSGIVNRLTTVRPMVTANRDRCRVKKVLNGKMYLYVSGRADF